MSEFSNNSNQKVMGDLWEATLNLKLKLQEVV